MNIYNKYSIKDIYFQTINFVQEINVSTKAVTEFINYTLNILKEISINYIEKQKMQNDMFVTEIRKKG